MREPPGDTFRPLAEGEDGKLAVEGHRIGRGGLILARRLRPAPGRGEAAGLPEMGAGLGDDGGRGAAERGEMGQSAGRIAERLKRDEAPEERAVEGLFHGGARFEPKLEQGERRLSPPGGKQAPRQPQPFEGESGAARRLRPPPRRPSRALPEGEGVRVIARPAQIAERFEEKGGLGRLCRRQCGDPLPGRALVLAQAEDEPGALPRLGAEAGDDAGEGAF